MSTLIDLTKEAEALSALFAETADANGELDNATLDQWADEHAESLSAKMEAIGRLRKAWDLSAEAKRAEAKRLVDSAKALENRAERLDQYVRYCLDAMGIKRIQAGPWEASIVANGGKAPLIIKDQAAIPDDLFRLKKEPDNDKIRQSIEQGRLSPDVAVIGERGVSLRWK